MKYLLKKQWLLPSIAGVSLILSVVGMMQVVAQPNPGNPFATPLSPDDPAAKLDQNLLKVPPMSEAKQNSPKKYPLSPDDPAAKLDESLLNVPPIPEGKIDSSSRSENSQSTSKVESYDVETGTVEVSESKPVKPSSKSPQASPPFRGAN
ncbi:MAG: hypothetical protein U7123_03590 [Potamolinea sp.]